MNPTNGTVLNSRYTLTERIATGGMSEVWAATDTVLGRAVAVKLLSPALSQQSGFLDRFRAEARHSAALHHPNITTVFDYGEDDGSAYLVMELVGGKPLSQLISESAPLPAQATASILIQAATALEAAHQGGVVHRDVKPANILITPEGTAKLTDFGISRLVNTAPLTQTGQVLGTAQYLSPEQAMGEPATPCSDIYALGVVGYEMLTGQRPFERDTIVATALAHVNEPPPELPDTVPAGIRSVVSAALAKDPADRPATAAAMAQALGMPDATVATGRPSANPSAVAPSAVGASAVGPSAAALSAAALGAMAQQGAPPPSPQTQVSGALSPTPPTRAMPAVALPQEPPAMPQGRQSGRRPAWLIPVFAASAAIGVAAILALTSGLGLDPAKPTVSPASPPAATPSSSATVVVPLVVATTPAVATPAVTTVPVATVPVATVPVATVPVATPLPRQGNKGRGKDDDKNKEDGKQ